MNASEAEEREAGTQAAEWLERLESADEGAQRDFSEWIRKSPLHVQKFLMMSALEKELESFTPAISSAKVVPFIPRAATPTGNGRWMAAAACLILAIGAAATFVWFRGGETQELSTAVGEVRDVALADGSRIQVNAVSALEVDYSRSARNVRLLKGEAVFTVAHDTNRPFQVKVGDTVVRATGTQFDVSQRERGVAVAVLEGSVLVTSRAGRATVSAGQRNEVTPDGRVMDATKADVASMAAWRDGRLVFAGETLDEIAKEFNRHNLRPHLVIEGEELRQMMLGGSFNAHDPETLLRYLEKVASIEVERRDDLMIIRQK